MNILALDPATKCVPVIRFTVLGSPVPQGSKRHVGHGVMLEDKRLKPWRQAVAWEARHACILSRSWFMEKTCAISLGVRVVTPRPSSHYGAKGLRKSAPALPFRRKGGDLDKIARGIGDALTGVLFRDDKQIVRLVVTVEYGEPERVEIEVSEYQEASK